ncbi:MAG TPA: hypothetical protein VGQ06_02750 [Gemmatimonadales bacterium]|jgi:hypothetical protein|nr:hypothetical protein [Gemmatimonadales bacterium]
MPPPQSSSLGQTQWARPRADVNRGLRRGAWYRVITLTPQMIILDVNHNVRAVPREGVDLVATPPQQWSIVPRPRDAVRVPDDWGDRYALCPACRNRTVLKGHPGTLRCPRCAGLFHIGWNEVEPS